MIFRKKTLIVGCFLFLMAGCGGGGGSSSTPAPTSSAPSSVIGCDQHSDFFEQLSGDRVGTITTFSSPGNPSCQFEVMMSINNDPSFNSCQVTANVTYTTQTINTDGIRVCDAGDGQGFTVQFGEAIALQDQVSLPLQLIFQPMGSQPLQANGFLIEYPIFGGSNVEVDANFNINVEGQFLTRP